MMVGDKRKYNTCLVSLRAVGATGEQPGTDDLDGDALLVNPEVKTVSAAMKDAAFRKHIHDVIVATNKDPKVRGANLPGPGCARPHARCSRHRLTKRALRRSASPMHAQSKSLRFCLPTFRWRVGSSPRLSSSNAAWPRRNGRSM